MRNPFHPSFGVSPPLLVGRDELLADFAEGLDDGPGSAARATLYTGARGSGKTAMLNAVEDQAKSRGWLVISETASPGFVARLVTEHLPRLLGEIGSAGPRRRLTGLTAPLGLGAAAWEPAVDRSAMPGLRSQLAQVTDLLAPDDTGLLLTLDEIHHQQVGELRDLATTLQHAFREERQIAFAGAGLSTAVSDVTADEVLTFLRRADRHHLGPVGRAEIQRALREPIEAGGRAVSDDALSIMADATHGYPFLIQLVGSHAWRRTPTSEEIDAEDAHGAVVQARRRLGSLVHEPAIARTSEVDRSFLLAMALDDGPSRMIDLQRRLEADANYVSQYRLRLIAAELVSPVRRGYVTFTLPYLREYLREHVAVDLGEGSSPF